MDLINPRFRTKEDADRFMECLRTGAKPKGLMVCPFKMLGNGDVVQNPDYRDAPYECQPGNLVGGKLKPWSNSQIVKNQT